MRKIIRINKGWKFNLQQIESAQAKEFSDANWEDVSLPHSWNAIDGAVGLNYYQGACWYRKKLKVEKLQKGQKVYIEFRGSNSITDVFINGEHVGQHKGGYSTFRFDITAKLILGEQNTIAVLVDNTIMDDVYPQRADFTFYGGIYRDVNLIITNEVHFDLLDHGSQGIFIHQQDVNHEKATLLIESKVNNQSEEARKVRLWIEIYNKDKVKVCYAVKEVVIDANSTQHIGVPIEIDQPELWNGKKNPYLYEAKVALISYNDTVDEITIPFGVRFYHVDSEKGLLLNGEPLRLNGVSRHQDRKDLGWAITEKDMHEDMEYIKEIGATSIRLAHYQHDQYFYDLCDEAGMVIWAEIPFITVMSKGELDGKNAKIQLVELIRQNYNHPSILFWGLHNEIQIGGERAEVRQVVEELNALAKKEDKTRLTTMANVMFVKDDDPYNFISDVLGYNKYFGWYHGEVEAFAKWIDGFHKINPKTCLCISEYGAEGIVEYHSDEPVVKDYTEEYHALYHEKAWQIFKQREFLWATYVWNMFDFGANIRDEGGVQGRNNKGLITFDRKIKKDAFYLYKANWSDIPFVHINSKRFVDRATSTIKVKVYSNCRCVTLYSNDIEISSMMKDDCVFEFVDVPLNQTFNQIKVVGVSNTDELVEDIAIFHRVEQVNESYKAPSEHIGESVENWFEMPDLSDVVVDELEIPEGVFSTYCTFKEILENEEAKAVLRKYQGNVDEHPMFKMIVDMTVDASANMQPDENTAKKLYMMNKEFIQIKK